MSPGDFANPFDSVHVKDTALLLVLGALVSAGAFLHFQKTGEEPPKSIKALFTQESACAFPTDAVLAKLCGGKR